MFLILGFTKRTSFTLAKYLSKQQKHLIVADYQKTEEQQSLLKELATQTKIIDELGNQEITLLDNYNISRIFISPGVPRSIPLVQEAIRRGIEILNDIEYFYELFPNRQYIGITGTDGKTTVTTWLGHVLSNYKKTVMVGNIGTPIFEYVDSKYEDAIFIVELSSFQLESIHNFCPHIAVITNIHKDHLDRYASMEDYMLAKKNIFLNQIDSDIALINKDNKYNYFFNDDIQANKCFFSCENQADVYFNNGQLYYGKTSFIYSKELQVVGLHNVQNALIVLMISKLLGADDDTIKEGLISFTGVAHRLEYLGEYQGVKFYNDSKATTLQSLTKALESFEEKIILLAGGQAKGLDYNTVTNTVNERAKKIFSFGDIREELSNSWGNRVSCCSKLEDAFNNAVKFAQKGDIIVLSPAATSFDEFESFEHRGNSFKCLVEGLTKNN